MAFGALSSGISALRSFSKGVEVIGDNIANGNTTSFKGSRVEYFESFNQVLGRSGSQGKASKMANLISAVGNMEKAKTAYKEGIEGNDGSSADAVLLTGKLSKIKQDYRDTLTPNKVDLGEISHSWNVGMGDSEVIADIEQPVWVQAPQVIMKGSIEDGGLVSTGRPHDLGIDGEGYFSVKDPNTGMVYATRKGTFETDKDGYLVTPEGHRVQGLSDGSIGFSVDVDADGEWIFIPDDNSLKGTITPSKQGDIRLDFDKGNASVVTEEYDAGAGGVGRNSIEYTNAILNVDASGVPVMGNFSDPTNIEYDHRFGGAKVSTVVAADGSETDQVTGVTGWHAFVKDSVNLLASLVGKSTEDSPVTTAQLQEAVSSDFFYRMFPAEMDASRAAGETTIDGNAVEDLFAGISDGYIGTPIDPTAERIAAMNLLPADLAGAKEMINSVRSEETPELARFAIDNDGDLRLFLDNGDSFVRGKIGLLEFENKGALSDEGNGLYAGFQAAGLKNLSPENPSGMVEVGEGGVGEIQQYALELAQVPSSSWKNITDEFEQGGLKASGGNTDLAVSGEGFFVVKDPSSGATSATRSGDFKADDDGYLVTNQGERVQGFTGGSISFRTTVDADGRWAFRPDDNPFTGTILPQQVGDVRLNFDVANASVLSADNDGGALGVNRNAVEYSNALVYRNPESGEPEMGDFSKLYEISYQHDVGGVRVTSEDGVDKVGSVMGWNAFVPEVAIHLNLLANKANESNSITRNQLQEAVSSDFFYRMFPEELDVARTEGTSTLNGNAVVELFEKSGLSYCGQNIRSRGDDSKF